MQAKATRQAKARRTALAAIRRDDILVQGISDEYFRVMALRRQGNEEIATLMSLQTQRVIHRPKAYLQGMLAKDDGTWEKMV